MPEKITSQETSQEQLKEREATKMEAKWYFIVGGDPSEIVIHPNGKRYRKEPTGYSERKWFSFDRSSEGRHGPGCNCCWQYLDNLNKLTDRKFGFKQSGEEQEKIFSDELLYWLIPESEESSIEREATPMERKWELVVGGDRGEIIVIDGKKYRKAPYMGLTEKQAFSHLPGPLWGSNVKYVFDLEKLAGRYIDSSKVELNDDGDQMADFSNELLYRLVPVEENPETSL